MSTSTWQLPLLLRRVALLLPLLCLSWLVQAQAPISFYSGSLSNQTTVGTDGTNRAVQFRFQAVYTDPSTGRSQLRVGAVVPIAATIDFGDGTAPEPVRLTVLSKGSSVDPQSYFTGEFTTTHFYASPGTYTATVRGGSRLDASRYVLTSVVGVGAANDSPVWSLAPFVVQPQGQGVTTFSVPVSDPNGDALTYSLVAPAEVGSTNGFVNPPGLSINSSTGLLRFDPASFPFTTFSAVVKVSDSAGSSIFVEELVRFVAVPVPNARPVFTEEPTPVFGQEISATVGQPVTFTVRATDSDPGDVLTLVSSGGPTTGVMLTPALPTTGNPVQTTFTWTPTVANLGINAIGFIARDSRGAQANASVRIRVGSAPVCNPTATSPVAVADQLSTATGSALTFTAAQLLANDTDPLGRLLQVARVGTPSRGRLVTNADGGYTYLPDAGFAGPVSFQYQVQLAGPVLASPATGHYYEFVSAPGISWNAARAAAAARTYQGLQGYLATITSGAEKDALVGRFPGQYWYGASDAAVEGEWRWQTGPEAGQLFWRGTANGTATGYANWLPNQPDDFKNLFRRGGEDYGQLYGQSGLWNDLDERGAGGRLAGYVVEYGGLEACTPVLFATGTLDIRVGSATAQSRGLAANAQAGLASAGLEAAPNPSNGQFRLRVTAVQDGPAQLDLYDLQGRRVKSVFAGSLRTGEVRELPVEATELAAGVYLVRLQSGRQLQHLRIAIHK